MKKLNLEKIKPTPKTEIEIQIPEEILIKIGNETMTNKLGLPFNKTMSIKKKKGRLKEWKKDT